MFLILHKLSKKMYLTTNLCTRDAKAWTLNAEPDIASALKDYTEHKSFTPNGALLWSYICLIKPKMSPD